MNNNQTSTNENEIVLKTSVDKLTNDLMNEFEKKGVFNNPKKGVRISNEDMIDIQNTVSRNLDNVSLQKSLQGGVRTDVQKEDGLNFADRRLTNPQSLRLPSGEYSESELDRYRDSLLKPIQEQNQNKLVSFVKDLGKGGIHNFTSILEGIERRNNDNQKKIVSETPFTDYEIKNRYAAKYGLPSDSRAYATGKLMSEILLLLALSTIAIENVPTIVAFMVYSFIQILGSKAIKYARYEDDKKFTDGLVDDIANYFLMELLTRGLIKATDKTNILNVIKEKLEKLWKKIDKYLIENIGQPVRQANGTIIFKKYNGDTATPEEFYEHVMKNFRKQVQKRAKKREIVKKRLPNELKYVKINGNIYKEIWLPDDEYTAVHSAFTTYIMHTHYNEPILQKEYGDYVYTAVLEDIDGQLLPTFIGKKIIKGVGR